MKNKFFALMRTGLCMSIAILLLSFTPKETFFERIFSSLKNKLSLNVQPFLSGNNQSISIVTASASSVCTNLAADAVGGQVWEDFNFDGDNSTEAKIYGVAGIEVMLYNAANKVVATGTTDLEGQYLFANLSDNKYRVEFNIPEGMGSYTKASVSGINNQTTVQFVAPGNCANLGVGNPSRYCDATPHLITPCYISGEPTSGGTAGAGEVLVSYPYAAGASKTDVNVLAVNSEMGSTWGVAYARTSQDVFAAAMMKRHAGFGALGIGGIYRVNHADPTNPVVEEWLDLAAEGVNVGSDPRTYLLPDAADKSSHDAAAFDAVGKIGLGDIDLSEDEKTLYVLNLNNNGSIVAVDIENKTVTKNIPIPNPALGCGSSDDVRPWALSVYKGAIYVGFVCSGQTAGGGDMQFFIQKYDGSTFTTVVNESLNYEKGFVHASYNKTGPPEVCKNWETWIADFSEMHTAGVTSSGPRWCRPQPILSDIEFDVDGSMILAFMDRTGHQTGYQQATTDVNDSTLGHGYVGGDILRVYNNNGTYVLESGGKTLDGKGAGLNNLPGSVNGDTIVQGPGGGEFYNGEAFISAGKHIHQETTLGGITFSQNDNAVALNVMDPEQYFSGGTMWLNNTTGEKERTFTLYISHASLTPTPQIGSFGKAAGLGDLELACAPAPIEIGNYVWHDVNSDGIQNPDEEGIDGITVELIKEGVKIATTTTQNGGQYYFNKDGISNQNWETPGDKVLPNMEYCVRIALTDTALEERAPTTANADKTPNGDARDNDAESIDGYAKITLTTGSAGENAHEYDFGFTSTICLGGYVWQDKNTDGAQNDSEIGIANIEVELMKNNAVVAKTTTDKDGLYFFTSDGALNQSWTTADDKVQPEMSYAIRILHDQDNLAKHTLTEKDKTNDLKDSDGEIAGDYALINLTSGKAGMNQHNYDFGFQPTLCVGNLVWFDSNNNGIADQTEEGISGVELILYQVGGDGTKGIGNDVEIAREITDDKGHYLFGDLPEGVYYIKINDGIPDNMVSSLGTGKNGTKPSTYEPGFVTSTDINNDDNGTQMGAMVMSDTFTLGICTEPTNDNDDNPSPNPITDPNTNLTVDFGFIPCLSIGNLVWNDYNNNGLVEATEPGFANIQVILYQTGPDGIKSDDDVEINRMSTDAKGYYYFANLKPGIYYVKLTDIPSPYISSNGEGMDNLVGEGAFEPGAITNSDINNDDNGSQMGTMVMSDLVQLALYDEPITDGDNDSKTNMSVDFGLLQNHQIKLHNPCTCLDNASSPDAHDGQFTETITILSNQPGQTWTAKSVTGAYFKDSSPIPVGTVAKESGTEDGQYRYVLDVRHFDGQGYAICFTNGLDDLTVGNQCRYDQSCHYITPPVCDDCTPIIQQDTCLLTFIMGTDGTHRVDSLNCCDNKSTFTDDGTTDGLYADTLGKPRNDIFTMCPQNQWQQLTYHFKEFDLDAGDTLLVYDGRTVTDSLLGKFSGAGVGQTGGWVASTCSPSKNASSCLTFRFVTDGDNNKGTGWNGNFECTDRDIELTPPNINPPNLTCQVTTTAITINPATIKAGCGTVVDSQIVRIYNSKGVVCIDTCLAFDKSFQETFAIGQYRIEYKLKSDTVKTAQATFAVQGASHVCNDVVNIPLGSNCTIAISPDDLLERTCDTITDTLYYFITVKGLDKNGQEEVIVAGGGKGKEYPVVTKAQFDKYGGELIVDIEKRYYENLTFNICNGGEQSVTCRTIVKIADNSGPIFSGVTRDTFKVCEINLSEAGLNLTKPQAVDNCNEIEVVFSEVKVIDDGGVCDTTRAEVIWAAVDKSDNKTTITQNIVLIRSGINEIVKPADKVLTCGTDTEADFDNVEKVGIPGIKIGKITNGKLVPSDTLPLSTEKYVCGFILQKRDVQIEADCGKKLFRYWDILDWCQPNGGPIKLDTQYINLKDVTPPSFTTETLAFKTIDLAHFECRYDISKLANPAATDNCSAVTVRMDKVQRIENGQLWEIPAEEITQLNADSFRISWIAEDACHEQTINDTITQDILIQDVTKPSAVCTDKITVSMGVGAVKMHYTAFDGGSFDACGIQKYEVSRDEKTWGEYVTFDCKDVHNTSTVYLRVTDNNGNENICWMEVIVEDKIAPICSALADQTGTCDAQHADEFGPSTDANEDGKMAENEWVNMTEAQVAYYNAQYGQPNCSDNAGTCNELVIQQQYQLLPWPCGMLEIKRRVRAIDWMGEGNVSNWVEQKIKIDYKANWTITFPADWTGTCGEAIPSSQAYATNGTCDLLAVEMEEKTFVTDETACLKVLRTFTIINWCTYQAGEEGITITRDEDKYGLVQTPFILTAKGYEDAGKITYTQVLKVIDDKAPVVYIQEPDSCIYALDGDAEPYGMEDITPGQAPYECDELKTWTARAADCVGEENITWVSKLFKNGIMIYEGASNRIDYVVENKSEYVAEFWAYDGCGNSGGAKTETKKFWDCKKPTPYCLHGLAAELMPAGMIQVWAKDLDIGSYDNCTPSNRLDVHIHHAVLGNAPTTLAAVQSLPKQVTLNCTYLGVQEIRIYVIDEEGNWDFCETYVNVQDNMGACEGLELQSAIVAGTVMDWKGNTVEAVQVTASNADAVMTPTNGQYAFNLLMNADYTITPAKDVQPLNGVSTFDLVLISKHILGLTQFSNPYQYIAADVNQSGSVTAFDMVQLRRLILNLDTEFINNTSWKFVETKYQFTTNNPATENYPTLSSVNNLAHDMEMNFTAVKIGDVNGNARTNSLLTGESRTPKATFTIETPNINLVAGQPYTVNFMTTELSNIEGYQFTLSTGNLQFEQLTNGITSIDNFGLHRLDKGYITTSWNNPQPAISNLQQTNLFTINFTATSNGKLSEQLSIIHQPTAVEAYNTAGELLDIQLNFTNTIDLTKAKRKK